MNAWNIFGPLLTFVSAAGGIVLMAINLRKARTIEDTPTAKIRSAAQGYLSINGLARAIDDDKVIAPLTGRPCLWYHYTIERRDRDNDGSRWTTIEKGTSDKFFLIDDTTGICHVDPRRAEVNVAISQCWQGDERHPTAQSRSSESSGIFFKSDSIFSKRYGLFSPRYRYRENRIHAQEWVYALGWFETLHAPSLAERTEAQTKLLLNQWKQDRDALLARFDINRDGEISMQEWERARRAAHEQAKKDIGNEPMLPAINTISHSPLRDQSYLIGTQDPRDMASKYRRNAFFSLLAGFGFAGFMFCKFYLY